MNKHKLIRRLQKFLQWRKLDAFKLLYALHSVNPPLIRYYYVLYLFCLVPLSALRLSTRAIEVLFNRVAKTILSRTSCLVKYKLREDIWIAFSVPDLESIEIVSPLFEFTNLNLIVALIKKFGCEGTFIDCGSHVGKYSITLSKMYPSLKIVAIEPNKVNFMHLLRNIRINNVGNVIAIKRALYSCKGLMKLFVSDFLGRHSIMFKRGKVFEVVQATTLDEIVTTLRLKPVIIKIDVEGAEKHVIRGARATLTRYKPVVLVEVNDKGVFKELAEIGYKCSYLRELLTGDVTPYALCVATKHSSSTLMST